MSRRLRPGPDRWATLLVAVLALPLLAAAPQQRGLSLEVPGESMLPAPVPTKPARPPVTAFGPAPLPNRDIEGPGKARASTDPRVGPGLFTRSDGFRGDGFSKGSSAQTEQEKRVKPGAGFNLTVPFAPN